MIWQYLTKLSIRLPYHLTILLWSVFLREMKACMHKTISTRIFVAVLVITVKICKQLRGSSMADIFIEWNMARQKSRSELIQREIWVWKTVCWEKALHERAYCIFPLIWSSLWAKPILVKQELWLPLVGGAGSEAEVYLEGAWENFLGWWSCSISW